MENFSVAFQTISLRHLALLLGGFFILSVACNYIAIGFSLGSHHNLRLPVVGRKTDLDFRVALQEGQRMYPNRAFSLPTEPPLVILPYKMINVLKSAPESLLSADKEVHRRALGQYTDLGVPMPEMYNAIKVDLTRHVRDLIPIIQDEVAYAFNHNLHFEETEEWQEVTAFVLIKHVVTIVNSVVFVGRRLSRDRNWQELAYKYSDDLRAAFDALNEWPVWLRPFVHPWILKRIGFTGRRRTVAAMLNPLLHDQNSGPSDDPTLLKWIRKRLGFQRSNDTALLARMELRAILASSDTVSQALTNAVFDLAAMPEHIEPMRDEVASLVSQAKNGAWDMTMVRNMGKVDSLLRESTRVYAPFLVAMGRITTSQLSLDDGHSIPKNTTVYFDMYNAHRSREVGMDEKYDGFRYSRLREEENLPNKCLAATTGPNYLPFGHGSHSCPGRFYAVAAMKIILAQLLLNYDIKLPSGERPTTKYSGIAVILDRQAKILIRRRGR